MSKRGSDLARIDPSLELNLTWGAMQAHLDSIVGRCARSPFTLWQALRIAHDAANKALHSRMLLFDVQARLNFPPPFVEPCHTMPRLSALRIPHTHPRSLILWLRRFAYRGIEALERSHMASRAFFPLHAAPVLAAPKQA